MSLTSEFTMAPKAAPVDHADGQIDGVSAKRELSKFLQHGVPRPGREPPVCEARVDCFVAPYPDPARPVKASPVHDAPSSTPRTSLHQEVSGAESRRASATDGGLHLLQGVEFFCRPSDVLLHVEDRRPELAGRTRVPDSPAFLITSPSCASALRCVTCRRGTPPRTGRDELRFVSRARSPSS